MSWEAIVEGCKSEMEAAHTAREAVLGQTRKIIQTSSKCIRHVHRKQFVEAKNLLEEAQTLVRHTRELASGQPRVLYAGYIQDAEKEMVEAAALLAMVQGQPFPSPQELGVDLTSYLNGMGEAASEARRYVLDEMRQGSLAEAIRLLGLMETIYDDLITFDFPDSLTGGLRRTCDALRAVIERTRSDLTLTTLQQDLLAELRRTRPS
ncbi:MAG TPA: hypothetical protein PLO61_10600 [Fimbriimonadaceae bacterium]|nr:hypothetical protein [Fimbriimonadaceae bacterium]HRJ34220.1 hypothetical protein [Fimbriimonadaceae bacterium]